MTTAPWYTQGAMGGFSTQEIEQRLKALPGWSLTPDGIRKTYRQANFRAAVGLVKWVAEARCPCCSGSLRSI